MSPALTSMAGFLSSHRSRFTLSSFYLTAKFDNGSSGTIPTIRVHSAGSEDKDDIYIGDVEGDVYLFSELSYRVLCTCSSSATEALEKLQKHYLPAAFLKVA